MLRSAPSSRNFAAGGAKMTEKDRSAPAAKPLGRRAKIGLRKNADRRCDYVDSVLEATTQEDLLSLLKASHILGRVTRPLGAGSLEVTLQTGETGIRVPISGSLRFRGRSATKGAIPNCMSVDDIILITGGMAAAKLSRPQAARVSRIFSSLQMKVPKAFFAQGPVDEDGAVEGFEWDTTEEAQAEEEADAHYRTRETTYTRTRDSAIPEVEEAAVETETEVKEATEAAAAPAEEKAAKAGPNRKERRAAAAAAAEAAREAAELAALYSRRAEEEEIHKEPVPDRWDDFIDAL
jgi:hypothetical protein